MRPPDAGSHEPVLMRRERNMSLTEISRRLGSPPPVPVAYSREFYSRVDRTFNKPSFS